MSVAKEIPDIHPYSLQACPLCSRLNRIVVKGVFKQDNKIELQPDSGYSFCNCKNMFYTRTENLRDPFSYEPVDGIITAPDPLFAWPDPYQFHYWDIRRYEIIWPMDALCDYLESKGYRVISACHDFDVHSKTPQNYHIKVSR